MGGTQGRLVTGVRMMCAVVVLGACGHAPARPVTVELALQRVSTGHIIVPVTIGEHADLAFVLDTGASATVITPATRQRLGLRTTARGDTVVGAGGASGQASSVVVPRLVVGGREYRDLEAWVTPLDEVRSDDVEIAGVLGRDFLAQHRVEIDFARERLRLHPAGRGPASTGRGLVSVPFRDLSGLLLIEVSLDGGPAIPAVVDLGAQASIVNRRAVPLETDTNPVGALAMGADGTPLTVVPHRLGELRVGTGRFPGPTVYVADLPVFAQLGLGDRPAMILGLDLLARGLVIIDYGARELTFTPGAWYKQP